MIAGIHYAYCSCIVNSFRIMVDRVSSIRFEFSCILKKRSSEGMINYSSRAFKCFHFAVQDRKLRITVCQREKLVKRK